MPGHSTTMHRWCLLRVIGRVAPAIGAVSTPTLKSTPYAKDGDRDDGACHRLP